jgi:predicted RNase H-like HicB family nuclease
MKRTFTASIVREGELYVAQCLEIDIASQGTTADEAMANLGEAISLFFEPPTPTFVPDVRSVEVEIAAA